MDIKFDSAVNMKLRLSSKDIEDARQIKLMMKSEGWKILEKYVQVAKESILDNIKRVAVDHERKVSSSEWGAALRGWDQHTELPILIVGRLEQHILNEIKQQEEHNETQPDEL